MSPCPLGKYAMCSVPLYHHHEAHSLVEDLETTSLLDDGSGLESVALRIVEVGTRHRCRHEHEDYERMCVDEDP